MLQFMHDGVLLRLRGGSGKRTAMGRKSVEVAIEEALLRELKSLEAVNMTAD